MKTLLSIVALASLSLSVSTTFAGKDQFSTSASMPRFSVAQYEAPSLEISAEELFAELADATPDSIEVSLEISLGNGEETISAELANQGFESKFDLSTQRRRFDLSIAQPLISKFAKGKRETSDSLSTSENIQTAKEEIRSGKRRYVIKIDLADTTAASEIVGGVDVRTLPAFGELEPKEGDVTGDHQINIDDLLTVINNWGIYDWPTYVDIAPPEEPDYSVDFQDLMVVLMNWGR